MSYYTQEMIDLIDAEMKPIIAERDALFDENERLSNRIERLEALLRKYMETDGGAEVVALDSEAYDFLNGSQASDGTEHV